MFEQGVNEKTNLIKCDRCHKTLTNKIWFTFNFKGDSMILCQKCVKNFIPEEEQ